MRFFINSAALLTELVPHESRLAGEERITVALISYRGYLDLWSDNATTGLPVESGHALVAYCALDKLLAALREIDEQTITLDLHEFGDSALYASVLIDEDKPERTDIKRYI